MLDISFEVNGRKVRPAEIGDEFEKMVLEGIQNQVCEALQGIVDPDTGRPPRITLEGPNMDNLKLRVEGSDEAIEAVRHRLDI